MIPGTQELLDLYDKVLKEESHNNLRLLFPVKDALTLIQRNNWIDYNNCTYRYAYIYYYAVCHTSVVTLQASRFLRENARAFYGFMGYQKEVLNICSLGGGPGCELIGLLRARADLGETKQINCTVVDVFSGWQHSLKYLLTAYLNSPEGSKYKEKLRFDFVRADLLSSAIRHSALERIEAADIVTLVNFVSAIPVDNRSDVLRTFLGLVKPGAYIFFSDYGNSTYGNGTAATVAKEIGLTRICQGINQESISRSDLPSIGPLEITVPLMKQNNASFVVWKQKRYRLRSK